MSSKRLLAMLFVFVLASLSALTLWASTQQPVWNWQGLTSGPDRWWTRATLMDAYYGFVTFFVWVAFKERSAASKALWFVAIMTLGNMAMATYVLLQLKGLKPGEPASAILTSRQ